MSGSKGTPLSGNKGTPSTTSGTPRTPAEERVLKKVKKAKCFYLNLHHGKIYIKEFILSAF